MDCDNFPAPSKGSHSDLSWSNVSIALAFILYSMGVSTILRLSLGTSIFIAAMRCIGQLAFVAGLLHEVFETQNPWTICLITLVLNFLGTIETVINKSKRRFQWMFPAVLIAMLGSTIPIASLGSHFAMEVKPFWIPIQFNFGWMAVPPRTPVPLVGMLCGSTISGVAIAVSYVLKELSENRDKVEIYLAFGATRTEATRPIAISALRLALTPPINNMSVLGIISIPGMMTGAILGGSSVAQAAKLQMVIMFMLTASTTLASIFTTFTAVLVAVDAEHRIRADRIHVQENGNVKKVMLWLDVRIRSVWGWVRGVVGNAVGKVKLAGDETNVESQVLLGEQIDMASRGEVYLGATERIGRRRHVLGWS